MIEEVCKILKYEWKKVFSPAFLGVTYQPFVCIIHLQKKEEYLGTGLHNLYRSLVTMYMRDF